MMSVLQSKVNALVMLRLSGLKVNKKCHVLSYSFIYGMCLEPSIYKKINKLKKIFKKKRLALNPVHLSGRNLPYAFICMNLCVL